MTRQEERNQHIAAKRARAESGVRQFKALGLTAGKPPERLMRPRQYSTPELGVIGTLQRCSGGWLATNAKGEQLGTFKTGQEARKCLEKYHPAPMSNHRAMLANREITIDALRRQRDQLRDALRILRNCIADDGTVQVNAATGQFKPVVNPDDAQTILGAVDALLARV